MKFHSDALVYLASPYTAPTAEERAARYHAALKAARCLEGEGWMVFSPIAYGHQFAVEFAAPFDWDSWARLDQRLIRACDLLVVLCIDGWDRSRGVAAEREYAESLGKPVWGLLPGPDGYRLVKRADWASTARVSSVTTNLHSSKTNLRVDDAPRPV